MTESVNNAPALHQFRIRSISSVVLGHWNWGAPEFEAWYYDQELGIQMVAKFFPGNTKAVINKKTYWVVGYENTGAETSRPTNVKLKMSPLDPARGMAEAQEEYLSVPWQAVAEAAEAEGVLNLADLETSRGGIVLPPGSSN